MRSNIEWTEKTWNPTTGCTKVKGCADCAFCYAQLIALKLRNKGVKEYKNGFRPTMQPHRLSDPFFYDRPSIVFVNSMSDLFHEHFPLDFIKRVFMTMNKCPQHQFQILTKRPERALNLSKYLNWTKNIWMGTSVGTNSRVCQIDFLRGIPAHIRFVSFEPLLTRLKNVNLEGIVWAILGGESPGVGGGMRPSKIADFIDLVNQCDVQGTKVFVKQLGGVLGKQLGMIKNGMPDLKGGDFSKFPRILKRREFPIDMSAYQLKCT